MTFTKDNPPPFTQPSSTTFGYNPAKPAFNASVRERALVGYEEQIRPFTTDFIPFDEAWEEVLAFVARLSLPD